MITFYEITLEGFGSIVNKLKYRFNNAGLTIIRGKNGAGKTTIFSALMWVLKGKSLKEKSSISTWESLQTESYQGTRVKVYFEKDGKHYVIYRHQNYKGKTKGQKGANTIMIFVDGEEEPCRDKVDAQKFIDDVLGFSYDLFRSTIIFGQRMKRLIQEDGPMKKKILEEAFEVGFLTVAKTKAEEKQKELYQEKNEKEREILVLQGKQSVFETEERSILGQISLIKQHDETDRARIRDAYHEIVARIKQIKQELPSEDSIADAERQHLESLEKRKVYKDLESQFMVAGFRVASAEGAALTIQNQINTYEYDLENIPKTCKACGQQILEQRINIVKLKIQQSIDECKAKSLQAIEEVSKAKRRVKRLKSEISEAENPDTSASDNYVRLKEKRRGIKATLKNLKETRERLEAEMEIPSDSAKIDELKSQLDTIKSNHLADKLRLSEAQEELNKVLASLETYSWVIKDALSNSGIKAMIFDNMLSSINQRLLHYSSRMGVEVKMGINLASAHKDLYIQVLKNNQEIPYADFSGGQKQLIDVFIAFAVHDVITLEKNVNVLLIDEVFESLDQDNIELVSSFISEKSKSKSIHLITHLKDFEQSHANIVNLELVEGSSTLI